MLQIKITNLRETELLDTRVSSAQLSITINSWFFPETFKIIDREFRKTQSI